MSVRRAGPADLEDVLRLWRALEREQETLEPRYRLAPDAERLMRASLKSWLRDPAWGAFLAEVDGEAVGLALAEPWTPPPLEAGASETHLYVLVVAAEHQGRGLGRALVQAVRAWGAERGRPRLRATVLAANTDALAFWRAVGLQSLAVTLAEGS